MKKILSEKKYTINLSEFEEKKRYLSRLVTHLNNEILDDTLSPSDRAKLYTNLIACFKTLNEVSRDAEFVELEARITALEESKKVKP